MMATVDELVALLACALREPLRRKQTVKLFETMVWDTAPEEMHADVREVFADLAHDLSYFETDPTIREEDPTFYGHKRLETEIRAALTKLRDLGVAIPDEP